MAFVNLQRLLELNRDKGEAMGQRVAEEYGGATSGAERAILLAQSGLGLGDDAEARVAEAEGRARTLGGLGGLQAAMGPGAGILDAALAGRSSSLQSLQQRTRRLDDMLSTARGAMERRQRAEANWQQMMADARARQERQRQAEEERRRLRRSDYISNLHNYRPRGAQEYAEYSNAILSGRR